MQMRKDRCYIVKIAGMDNEIAQTIFPDIGLHNTYLLPQPKPVYDLGGCFQGLAYISFGQQLICIRQPARSQRSKPSFRIHVVAEPKSFWLGGLWHNDR